MEYIDPQRLKAIREAKGKSQTWLASKSNVSARQIVRIEGRGEPAEIRESTMKRLAVALDVSPNVLAGAAPLPMQGATEDRAVSVIMPNALSELRRRRNWSRRQLAEKSRVSAQRIEKIETSIGPTQVPKGDARRLARALRAPDAVLNGDQALGPPSPERPNVEMSLRTSPALQLAYDLVERRYGASAKDLFVIAPLLFVLLAEGSLACRRRKLESARQASTALEELAMAHPTLYFGKAQAAVRRGIELEEASIESADVMGLDVFDSDWPEHTGITEDDTSILPFTHYLEELANEVDDPDVVNFDTMLLVDQGLDPWGAEPYEVCRGELKEIANQSRAAAGALEWGDVRLSEIPKALMAEGEGGRRADWLESRLSEDSRRYAERPASLCELAKISKRHDASE